MSRSPPPWSWSSTSTTSGRVERTSETPEHDISVVIVLIGAAVPLALLLAGLAWWTVPRFARLGRSEAHILWDAFTPARFGLAGFALGSPAAYLWGPMLGSGTPASQAVATAVFGALGFLVVAQCDAAVRRRAHRRRLRRG